MGNINYDSFYKFLVSLGIVIVILPFAAMIFFITNSFDLQIAESDLSTYTKTAQNVIAWRQSIPLLIQREFIWFITGALAFVFCGGCLTAYGLIKWHELQKIDDICKKREAEKQNKAIEENIVEMSEDQIIQKSNFEDGSTAIVMKDFIIKQNFFNFIKSTKKTHIVKNNIKIGSSEYDVVAFSNKPFEKDYVYEVKYWKNQISLGRIEQCRESMKELRINFSEKLNRIPYMTLAIIVPDEMYEHTLSIIKQTKKWNNYTIELFRESDLKEQ